MTSSWLEIYVVADEDRGCGRKDEVQLVPGAVELGLAERRARANEIAIFRLGETPFLQCSSRCANICLGLSNVLGYYEIIYPFSNQCTYLKVMQNSILMHAEYNRLYQGATFWKFVHWQPQPPVPPSKPPRAGSELFANIVGAGLINVPPNPRFSALIFPLVATKPPWSFKA